MSSPSGPSRSFPEKATLAVLGSGSWGSTLATHLHNIGHTVRIWGHSQQELDKLRALGHPPGVPELRLPAIPLEANLGAALAGVDAVIFVIPAQTVAETCQKIKALGISLPLAIIASKGIDLRTLRPLSDVVAENLPGTFVAVVSGPCIAREVAVGIPTSVVSASAHDDVGRTVQHWFASPSFRVYQQRDVLGVEYGGALKNVIAIAAGVCDGLGFGANSKSALMTRGLSEMRRFAIAHGAMDLTVGGLAGLGDLCVTCFSPHSRNRRFGEALGKGAKPSEALASIGETVEGVPTAEAVVRLAEQVGIDVPIAFAVHQIVQSEWTARQAVEWLMNRELKPEF